MAPSPASQRHHTPTLSNIQPLCLPKIDQHIDHLRQTHRLGKTSLVPPPRGTPSLPYQSSKRSNRPPPLVTGGACCLHRLETMRSITSSTSMEEACRCLVAEASKGGFARQQPIVADLLPSMKAAVDERVFLVLFFFLLLVVLLQGAVGGLMGCPPFFRKNLSANTPICGS